MLASMPSNAYDLGTVGGDVDHPSQLLEALQLDTGVRPCGTPLDLPATRQNNIESTLPLSHEPLPGYTVAYDREEIQFPVYVVGFVGVCFVAAGFVLDNVFLIALALVAFGYAYHNYPLLETGRPRIGAGQYGIFAEGLGIVSWRAVKQIDLAFVEIRGSVSNELRITLQEPFERALLADWRKRPVHRFLMRVPWAISGKDVLRIPLDVFDHPAKDVHRTFLRMMTFYRR